MGSAASTADKPEDGPPTVTAGPHEQPSHGHGDVPGPDDRPQCRDEYLLETPSIEVVRSGTMSCSTDALKKYFSNNKRSGGGKIKSISEDDDYYVITFENTKEAQDVLSRNHVLQGTQLQVHHRKNPTVEVITDGTIDEERLKVYFTNTRASGGGPIERIKKDLNGVFYITFQHKRAAVDVVQKPAHFIEEKEVIVSEKLSLIDAKILLIKGIPKGCTNSFLRDYLEGLESAGNRLSIAGVFRGEDTSMAVVSLLLGIDGKTRRRMAKEVQGKPLSEHFVSVSPMVITRSVQLSGITKRFTQDRLLKYFEDMGQSGGGQVLDITTDEQQGTAIIRFKDPTGKTFTLSFIFLKLQEKPLNYHLLSSKV
ncbi:protein mono-ADP-ribosyltransferase PARP10-like [Branchiostoma lanceolatum]|uniref:protein mono-ADP-ribosyltransferase PARP10-like n=1 Tax=Branchiostoma lanceolatum TaxID=7740 RepID=UPI0034553CC4